MKNKKLVNLVLAAMIAALYAAATYLSAAFNLAYGAVQFRLSEALTILSVFTPAAISGLTVGCVLGNLSSPYGIWDILIGSAATLFAALCARAMRNIKIKGLPFLSIMMPVVFNAVLVGLEITFYLSDSASLSGFLLCAAEVALGETVVCLAGGIPLYYIIKKHNLFGRFQ